MAKTALVTGASSGIGREIAKLLSRKGFRVILAARNRSRLEETAEQLEGSSRIIVCDLSSREECLRLYKEVSSERVSVLVNGAGFGKIGSFTDIPTDSELEMIDTNVTAVHILTKLFLKDFVKHDRGYILNIASSAGLMPGGPLMATYYATKAYVVSLTSAIYEELKATGSRVSISALCPGPVDTGFNEVAGGHFSVKAISAEYCAEAALDGLFSKELIIVPESRIKLGIVAAKFAPRRLALAVTKFIQKSKQ
jgi:hypothetical protein